MPATSMWKCPAASALLAAYCPWASRRLMLAPPKGAPWAAVPSTAATTVRVTGVLTTLVMPSPATSTKLALAVMLTVPMDLPWKLPLPKLAATLVSEDIQAKLTPVSTVPALLRAWAVNVRVPPTTTEAVGGNTVMVKPLVLAVLLLPPPQPACATSAAISVTRLRIRTGLRIGKDLSRWAARHAHSASVAPECTAPRHVYTAAWRPPQGRYITT